jgi:hypothetical protein
LQPKLSHIAAAAGLAAFLGVGGMSLAYAQDTSTTTEDDSTPTTEDDSTTTEDDSTTTPEDDSGTRDENCPEKDGSGSDSSDTEGTSL